MISDTKPLISQAETAPPISPNQHWYFRLTLILLAAGAVFHLWYATRLELVGDEAYYWLWSRHLDFCYLDKGPMTAWVAWLGTSLLGQTAIGVRIGAILLAGGTALGLYRLGKELFSPRAGFIAVLLAAVVPLFAVGSSLLTPDTVYVFFWTWAALCFWRAIETSLTRWWIATGTIVGLGLLSKYTAAVELVSFLCFCLWYRPARVYLRGFSFWLMILIAALFLLPALFWNVQHHWPTSDWLLHRGAIDQKYTLTPVNFLFFLAREAAVISPLLFLGLLVLLARPKLIPAGSDAIAFAVSLFLPLFCFYAISSLHYLGPPNWTAASYIGGILLLAAAWPHVNGWPRFLAWFALGFAVLETSALLAAGWLHLPPKLDPMNRTRGARSLAKAVAEKRAKTGAAFVLSDNYMTASLLSFYLPGNEEAFLPPNQRPLNQLEIWANERSLPHAGDGLLVVKRPRLTRSLRALPGELEPMGEVDTQFAGKTIAQHWLYLWRRQSRPH